MPISLSYSKDPHISDAVAAANVAVSKKLEQGELPFASILDISDNDLRAIETVARKFRQKFSSFIIIGIGGSDLGARAVHRALNHQFYNAVSDKKLYFAGDTTDPEPLEEILSLVDLKQTGLVMISKSGNTIEVMSSFLVVRDRLKTECGHEYRDHIVVVTDPRTGILREIVEEEGLASLPHPAVGGRFSVLSVVGLLPLLLAGVPVHDLLKGGKDFLEHHQEESLRYAAFQFSGYEAGQHIHVFMPYVYSLREFGFWFRQLWAESLGKAKSLTGAEVHVGPTPVAALGPTDQHSQVQLYREGPNDKTFTFLTSGDRSKLTIPQDIPGTQSVQYLKGLAFADILKAELEGTEEALREVGRPTCTISLDALNAYSLGELIVFFELATTYMGALLQVDPFDQPGVERGKELMRSRLGEQV